MKRISILFILLLSVFTFTYAEINNHAIMINGESLDLEVNEITYDGDNVVLHWTDNSITNTDMSQVIMSLAMEHAGINDVKIYSLNGLQNGFLNITHLDPGLSVSLYDISGNKLYETYNYKMNGFQTIDINPLNSGIYLLKANNSIVKFIKK